jgi:hypothetical protein
MEIPRAIWNMRFFSGAVKHDATECFMVNKKKNTNKNDQTF